MSYKKFDPITFRGLHRGMADASSVADTLIPSTQWRFLKNMDIDAIGYQTRRKGYSRVGSGQVIADKAMLGLHHHIGTNSKLIAFCNQSDDSTAEAYYLSGSSWSNKSLGFTASTKIRTVTFLDYVIAVNGTDSPKSWDGDASNSWDSTLLSSAPTGSLIETYKQQVYIADTSNDKIYFSSVPNAAGDSITWDTSNDNFVVNPNDGSNITALKTYAQNMLIFKDNYIYRYNASSLDSTPLIPFGTPVQEAVVNGNGICWFYDSNREGMFAYAGGYPEEISKPVRSFIKAIPTSSHTDVVARADSDHVEWFIGDVTISGVSYTNISLRYTISTKRWTIRSYANTFKQFAKYDDGTDLWEVGGTNEGSVVQMDDGNDDLGTAISYEMETPWYTLEDSPSYNSLMAGFAVFVHQYGSLNIFYKTNLDATWREIGMARDYATQWSGLNIDFNRIKFRFTGTGDAEPLIFDGFSILAPIIKGLEKD